MDWTQIFTIMGTLIGAVYVFYRLTRDEIAVIREDMKQRENNHREDIQKMDAKIDRMDEKWERLFERLLLQDQHKNK